MVDVNKNIELNNQLSDLYARYTVDFLSIYSQTFNDAPPKRTNEFGIIDIEKYDADNGVLFIGKETNGWRNEDFEQGILFRGWLHNMSKNGLEGYGHAKKHPNIWYNMGRWAQTILAPDTDTEKIASMKYEALQALGAIAVTNINKVRGYNSSKKEYDAIAYSDIAGKVLCEEIRILKPKIIVTCGNCRSVCYHLNNAGLLDEIKMICMPHPAVRLATRPIIEDLKKQLDFLRNN